MKVSLDEHPRLLLTAREAAAMLAISPRKLWAMTQAGEIESVRIGRSVRYTMAGIQRFIDGHKEGGNGQ